MGGSGGTRLLGPVIKQSVTGLLPQVALQLSADGDLGMVGRDDVAILLSKSGESSELNALLAGNLGIFLAASSAAVINQVVDARIDAQMDRTRNRPLASGRLALM